MVKLIAIDGRLHVPNAAIHDKWVKEHHENDDVLLLVNYGMDYDTIPWPLTPTHYWTKEKLRDGLARALYDARETGVLPPYDREVVLPDGMAFEIERARFYCPECDRDEGEGHDRGNGCTVGEDNG